MKTIFLVSLLAPILDEGIYFENYEGGAAIFGVCIIALFAGPFIVGGLIDILFDG